MVKPKVGSKATLTGDDGLGQAARKADPGVSDEMRDGMEELDMPAGTVVEVIGIDDDRDVVLLEWVDGSGNDRITSVTEDDFAARFKKGGK
jgi:hypothetical protein